MSNVKIEGISKSFGSVNVLNDINLNIEDGSFTILLGPSGCGKSTLLRIIAGLETPDEGAIHIGEENVTKTLPGDRNVAMVFQNYALYPHLTVYQNIEYGLKARKVKKAEREERVKEAVEMVRLEDQIKKLPAHMSGGQRQRVALARAIVKRPRIFLMDEPLSNLDAKLRNHMRVELTELYNKLQTSFLYVTHDQVEAMSMGTHIVILDKGIIQQEGTPQAIYEDPDNLFVAGFIGSPPANILKHDTYSFAIRPENILLDAAPEGHIALSGDVQSCEHLGYETIYNVKTSIGSFFLKTPNLWDSSKRAVQIYITRSKVMVFDESGKRIREPREREQALLLLDQLAQEENSRQVLHVPAFVVKEAQRELVAVS